MSETARAAVVQIEESPERLGFNHRLDAGLAQSGGYGLAGFAEADERDRWLAAWHGDGSLQSIANDGSFDARSAMAPVSIAVPAR